MTSDAAASKKELSEKIYERCIEQFGDDPEHLFDPKEISKWGILPDKDMGVLMEVAQLLVDQNLFRIFTKGGSVMWKAIKREDAAARRTFTRDEDLVYQQVESAGREGIWTKTIKDRTQLHPSVVTKCIKSLENKNAIKRIRSVKNPTKIMYILYSLQPSQDVTGGVWYTEGALDEDFITVLSDFTEKFVQGRSWVVQKTKNSKRPHLTKEEAEDVRALHFQGRKPNSSKSKTYLPYPPGYKSYPTALEVARAINDSGILSGQSMSEGDMKTLLDTLCYDGILEHVNDGKGYKALRRPSEKAADLFQGNGFTEAPCGGCPVFYLCEEGGPVNPQNCEYFQTWLEY